MGPCSRGGLRGARIGRRRGTTLPVSTEVCVRVRNCHACMYILVIFKDMQNMKRVDGRVGQSASFSGESQTRFAYAPSLAGDRECREMLLPYPHISPCMHASMQHPNLPPLDSCPCPLPASQVSDATTGVTIQFQDVFSPPNFEYAMVHQHCRQVRATTTTTRA